MQTWPDAAPFNLILGTAYEGDLKVTVQKAGADS